MRVLLDAHLSARRIGLPLAEAGHDVRALNEERELEGLGDEAVLVLATEESRILVTRDVKDFSVLLRGWANAGRSHAGVILVYGLGTREFALVLRGVERWLERRPAQDEWVDVVAGVDRAFASG
jgi:hypothetical protein